MISNTRKTAISGLLALIVLLIGPAAAFSAGSGPDDWWTAYPGDHSEPGVAVEHPRWILEALDDGPVLIYGHKQCSICAPQEAAIEKLKGEYDERVEFYDIMTDGSDARYVDIAAYDPNGGAHYVPLTVLLTLVQGPDGVDVGWHSTEEITGEDWIRSYLEDGLEKYDRNSEGWEK